MSELWLNRYKHNEELRNFIEKKVRFKNGCCTNYCQFVKLTRIGIKKLINCRLFNKNLKCDLSITRLFVFRCEECKRIFGE